MGKGLLTPTLLEAPGGAQAGGRGSCRWRTPLTIPSRAPGAEGNGSHHSPPLLLQQKVISQQQPCKVGWGKECHELPWLGGGGGAPGGPCPKSSSPGAAYGWREKPRPDAHLKPSFIRKGAPEAGGTDPPTTTPFGGWKAPPPMALRSSPPPGAPKRARRCRGVERRPFQEWLPRATQISGRASRAGLAAGVRLGPGLPKAAAGGRARGLLRSASCEEKAQRRGVEAPPARDFTPGA